MYAFRSKELCTGKGVHKPIGYSQYRIPEALPEEFKSPSQTIEEIEDRLKQEIDD